MVESCSCVERGFFPLACFYDPYPPSLFLSDPVAPDLKIKMRRGEDND
jgi:hypothetical protein